MRYLKYLIICVFCLGLTQTINAHVNPEDNGVSPAGDAQSASLRMDCDRATAQIDMEINNVRARLLVGGDIWWDGDDGLYIVTKTTRRFRYTTRFFSFCRSSLARWI